MKLIIVAHLPGGTMPLAILPADRVDLPLSAGGADIRREQSLYFTPARGLRTTP
ncbi:hypothetical protein ABZ807_30590 [Micromonospora sp. NPDC047548]|uniref:hypothetical protein n=1 Tax=Micromonospora sp. NPDC047548 TaxID=3155624 RepID=UPI0033F3F261